MSFLTDLLGRFDEALDWPADPLLPDDEIVRDWVADAVERPGLEARAANG